MRAEDNFEVNEAFDLVLLAAEIDVYCLLLELERIEAACKKEEAGVRARDCYIWFRALLGFYSDTRGGAEARPLVYK